MKAALSLNELWDSASNTSGGNFTPELTAGLPDFGQRYLCHAITPGAKLASAVRLKMHGEIKLKSWFPFTAEQVIAWDIGMIWNATVKMYGAPIYGFDRLINHEGEAQWKMLGLIPIVSAKGHDTTRSCAGRILTETVWLPSILCRKEVVWQESGSHTGIAGVIVEGERSELTLSGKENGALTSSSIDRWGNLGGDTFRSIPFGGIVEKERYFGGYTIPSELRVGWYFDTPKFESEGEFFRCTVDHAEFR